MSSILKLNFPSASNKYNSADWYYLTKNASTIHGVLVVQKIRTQQRHKAGPKNCQLFHECATHNIKLKFQNSHVCKQFDFKKIQFKKKAYS